LGVAMTEKLAEHFAEKAIAPERPARRSRKRVA
jgi:hypothetical protein